MSGGAPTPPPSLGKAGGGALEGAPTLPLPGSQEGEHTLSRPLGHPATQYSDDDDSNHDCDDEGNDNDYDIIHMTWDVSWIYTNYPG